MIIMIILVLNKSPWLSWLERQSHEKANNLNLNSISLPQRKLTRHRRTVHSTQSQAHSEDNRLLANQGRGRDSGHTLIVW